MQHNSLDSKIYYYESAIEDPQSIIDIIERTDEAISDSDPITKWEQWDSSDHNYTFGKRKYLKHVNGNQGTEISIACEQITNAIKTATYHYSNILGISPGRLSPISISKYDINKHMGPHADSGPQAHISAVMYLNDSYIGGELNFPYQKVCVKPSAGSIIVFPSVEPYIHDPMPNIDDYKYIASAFWLKD